MPTEPQPVTFSQVVHRAVEVCEDSTSDGLDELLRRFEDDDEPVTGIEDVEARVDEKIEPPEFDARAALFAAAGWPYPPGRGHERGSSQGTEHPPVVPQHPRHQRRRVRGALPPGHRPRS